MRLLHVCETLPGGPAAYIQDIVPDQVERFGVESVTLLVPAEQTAHLGPLADRGGPRIVTFRRTGRNLASLARLAAAMWKEMRSCRHDIVHLHSTFAGILGRLMPSSDRWPRVVYCAHCWCFARSDAGWKAAVYSAVERWLARRTDLVIDIAPHEIALRQRHGIHPRGSALVVTGIASVPVAPPNPRDAGQPLRLLYIGRTDRQKGFDLLMREIADIDPRRAVLTVVGTGFIDQEAVTVPPQVETIGWVERSEVHRMISSADVVVMPSRWDGMPILALEVLRAGRPLLASGIPPFDAIVRDGVDGLLMDIDAPGFLARALDRLEASDLLAMGAAARDAFETRFRIERMQGELVRAYEKALGPDHPAHARQRRSALAGVKSRSLAESAMMASGHAKVQSR